MAGGGAAQPSSIRSRVGYLQKIVVTAFVNAQDLLNLRLGLQQEVFWRTTTKNETCGAARFLNSFTTPGLCRARITLRGQDYRRSFIHIQRWVKRKLVALERLCRYVHADRRVTWR